ncbi:Glutaredoxin [Artemisia annua]|uniref:Glutaredoxin n=1 Tax=Artemisia annua TaxID=35608 RepID=A0A2U1P312_ARTAN|nr:Glutaredoxin [Artemisia annua]
MTSLRVVRSTYEACHTVRSILQGFRVMVEDRDLSMDSSFREELRKIMSQGGKIIPKNKVIKLPKVFIGGRYIGDAEDLQLLNETGELKKLVEGLPIMSGGVCEACGDFRFIICMACNGSRRCYKEEHGFRLCMYCNKNGLTRCDTCCTLKS